MNIPVDANGGDLIHQVERVRELLSAVATGSSTHVKDEAAYKEFRKKLMTNAVVAPLLPHFLERCRTLGDFWTFIKPRTKTYQERREFLLEQFDPLLPCKKSSSG